MHSFGLSTTVLAVLAIAIPICRAASIMESIFPALPFDPDLIGTPDLTKFFGDVGEGGFGGVGTAPAVIPVTGEKAVKNSRLHAEERAEGAEIWYAHKLGRRSLVADTLGAAKPLTQAVGSKLLPAVEATVQAVSPPAADAVTEVVNTVEGALDLVA